MTVAIAGARVARTQFGTVHIADRWGDPGVVLARCGNTIAHPQWQRLMGARCPACHQHEVAPAPSSSGAGAASWLCKAGHRTPVTERDRGAEVGPCRALVGNRTECSRPARRVAA